MFPLSPRRAQREARGDKSANTIDKEVLSEMYYITQSKTGQNEWSHQLQTTGSTVNVVVNQRVL